MRTGRRAFASRPSTRAIRISLPEQMRPWTRLVLLDQVKRPRGMNLPDPIIRVFAVIRVHPNEGEVYSIPVLRSSSRLRLSRRRARIGANPVCASLLQKPKTLIDMTRVEWKICGREHRNLQGVLGIEITQDSALT